MSQRIGIFGGTFNPVHLGHINSAHTVFRRLKLDRLFIVPAHENPLKMFVEGPSPEQRLEMAKVAFLIESEGFSVDDQEILRSGPSYTITTVLNYRKRYPAEAIYLILGADHLHTLERWKDFDRLVRECNLVFTSRPGSELPRDVESFPARIAAEIEMFEKGFAQLKSGRYIEFVQLEDQDVSASEVRKRIRTGQKVSNLIPGSVEDYIHTHGLYGPIGAKIGDFEKFTEFCRNKLDERKAVNVAKYDLRTRSAPSEFAVVASGTSTRHASSLAENLIRDTRNEYGVLPQGIEGLSEGRWVLLDYGSLIVHVFYDYVRNEYQLEELWRSHQ